MLQISEEELTTNPILNKCILAELNVHDLARVLAESNLSDDQISDYDRNLLWSYYDTQSTIEMLGSNVEPLVRNGLFISEIIRYGSYPALEIIIKYGYITDDFVEHPNDQIRRAAVEKCKDRSKFVNDPYYQIRKLVADAGQCLDKLINDENEYVRMHVARQGYGLDILVNDPKASVREEVAKQRYGLDQLINDKSEAVRKWAMKMKAKS